MQAFLAPLAELADYQEILKERWKEKGIIQIAGCVNSQKTHLMYALGDGCKYRVIVFSSEEKAKKAYEEYRFLTDDVFLYPARDLLFYHADIKGKFLTARRMEVLSTSKLRMESTSSPHSSILTGSSAVRGYTSSIPPRTANCPGPSIWLSLSYPMEERRC